MWKKKIYVYVHDIVQIIQQPLQATRETESRVVLGVNG